MKLNKIAFLKDLIKLDGDCVRVAIGESGKRWEYPCMKCSKIIPNYYNSKCNDIDILLNAKKELRKIKINLINEL
jgi:hypothetical protein